jgi:catechol 2,3-dioxygenase-like lactoylglutathione lyase family enzyme
MEVLSSRTIIATEDFDRSRAFYEETLGLSVYREYGSAGAVTGVVFFLGGGFLEVTQGSAHRAGDAVTLWLQVADLGRRGASVTPGRCHDEETGRTDGMGTRRNVDRGSPRHRTSSD